MKATAFLGALAAAILLAVTAAQAGPKVDFGDGGSLSFGVLGQVHGAWVDEAKDKEDIYLRRARLILSGQIADGIKVFAETDFPNAGKTGTSASFIWQDAFADVRIFGDHWLQAGLILLPFSFENASSAATVLGLDYNVETVKLTNTLNYRDLGAVLHGNFGTLLSYKAGVFDGYDNQIKNEAADLRLTGHVAVNLIGTVESGWFYNQFRFDKGTYLSVGAGVDSQKKATVAAAAAPGPAQDSDAWVADLQSGVKLGGLAHLTVNAAYYHWDSKAFEGKTSFVEAGLLAYDAMLTGKWSLQDPDRGSSVSDATVGLHYFLKGNSLRGGVEYRFGDSPDMVLAGIQFLL